MSLENFKVIGIGYLLEDKEEGFVGERKQEESGGRGVRQYVGGGINYNFCIVQESSMI